MSLNVRDAPSGEVIKTPDCQQRFLWDGKKTLALLGNLNKASGMKAPEFLCESSSVDTYMLLSSMKKEKELKKGKKDTYFNHAP
jgi:hypothetical protein